MQGFNKYYPPDYDPSAGSLNKYHGKHALGNRARKLDQGVLIVRFELPFNIWCDGCKNHIGQGVRYNAEKKKVGNYYSTTIWGFRCKCHLCDNWFEIRTDPQNTQYVVYSGAKAQSVDFDPAENGTMVLDNPDTSEKPALDPFASLEKTTTQKIVAKSAAAHLESLLQLQGDRWADPSALSKKLRKGFREEKKIRVEREKAASNVKSRFGLGDQIESQYLTTPSDPQIRQQEDEEWNNAKRLMKRDTERGTKSSSVSRKIKSRSSIAARSLALQLSGNPSKRGSGSRVASTLENVIVKKRASQ